ncbi:uncharacterized protein LOC126975763 [Leptidea sinapis]|uniref:uncharacterized protein LOC126975763 n=1 Tax=Leptidea sinapis TaxID=189913 RepID=UPI00213A4438|nr:uncharacterized protein LOC126975763 [Leptidea sinapis]XP_050679754.1 uncharacterized protein LOC126975763 [Leptidea sinapis]
MFASKVILLIGLSIVSAKSGPFYRRDYIYSETYDAFYKLHTTPLSYEDAITACADEGSKIFSQKIEKEWTIVKNLAENKYLSNVTQIFVGFQDPFSVRELPTVDGNTAPLLPMIEGYAKKYGCRLMDIDTGNVLSEDCAVSEEDGEETREYFICKRTIDELCPTIDRKYRYSENTKKCYKINYTQRTWLLAEKTCYLEGGFLAVIENDAEAKAISELINDNIKYFVGIGIRQRWNGIEMKNDYFNLKGKYLSDTGFNWWYSKQNRRYNINDGADTYDRENYECETSNYNYNNDCDNNDISKEKVLCGVVVKHDDIGYKPSDCNTTKPFICQMEVHKNWIILRLVSKN